jgi:uncharacterized membrane protein YdbT with pleckstrin-like domain
MSYVQQNLMKNEKVVYQADLHWWIFALPALLLIVGFIMVMSGGDVAGAGWALVIFGVIGFLLRWIKKVNSEFVVTNKRVILKQGLIKRNANEIMLSKAEGMNVDQGIIGRILGFGSIVITSGGALNTYRVIKDPLRFRKEINEQIEENYSSPVPAV